MNHNQRRDYNYYEAHAADVSLGDITSCGRSKQTLKWLHDGTGDPGLNMFRQITLSFGSLEVVSHFTFSKCNDLGWLGYFIGKSEHLHELVLDGSPEDEDDEEEEQRILHAISEGISRNQSIQHVFIQRLSNKGFNTIARALGNMTQLERLILSDYGANNDFLNECVTLGNMLGSGSRLKILHMRSNNIGDAGVAAFTNGFSGIGSSLEELDLAFNAIGSEGLSTLAAALANSTIKILNLMGNDFSMAAAGLRSLSESLQTAGIQLDELHLLDCHINDEGMQALTDGAVNHCKHIDLRANRPITASGWRLLSTALQSESCQLEELSLADTGIDDDDAELFARALVDNKTLRVLHLVGEEDEEYTSITSAGWSAFSKVLCDTSSVNNTYRSNHTIRELWEKHEDFDEEVGEDLKLYLELNQMYPESAAECKILMNHTYIDMVPLLRWELKCLPLAVNWFERAKPYLTLSIDDGETFMLVESHAEFQSRRLSALYEFLRGVPKKLLERRGELILVATCDEKVALLRQEKKRLFEDVVQRDGTITQLEMENKRLRGMVDSIRNVVNH